MPTEPSPAPVEESWMLEAWKRMYEADVSTRPCKPTIMAELQRARERGREEAAKVCRARARHWASATAKASTLGAEHVSGREREAEACAEAIFDNLSAHLPDCPSSSPVRGETQEVESEKIFCPFCETTFELDSGHACAGGRSINPPSAAPSPAPEPPKDPCYFCGRPRSEHRPAGVGTRAYREICPEGAEPPPVLSEERVLEIAEIACRTTDAAVEALDKHVGLMRQEITALRLEAGSMIENDRIRISRLEAARPSPTERETPAACKTCKGTGRVVGFANTRGSDMACPDCARRPAAGETAAVKDHIVEYIREQAGRLDSTACYDAVRDIADLIERTPAESFIEAAP